MRSIPAVTPAVVQDWFGINRHIGNSRASLSDERQWRDCPATVQNACLCQEGRRPYKQSKPVRRVGSDHSVECSPTDSRGGYEHQAPREPRACLPRPPLEFRRPICRSRMRSRSNQLEAQRSGHRRVGLHLLHSRCSNLGRPGDVDDLNAVKGQNQKPFLRGSFCCLLTYTRCRS